MARTKNRRAWFRRVLAPAAGLTKPFFWAAVGFAVFLAGFLISFEPFLRPIVENVAASWNDFLASIGGPTSPDATNHVLGGVLLVGGLVLCVKGLKRFFGRVARSLNPEVGDGGVVEFYVRKQKLEHGARIVALGGGTGLSTVLRGLKEYTSNVTAVVTVSDDGGSSGRLVEELGIIPPGDIRNCLVALAEAEKRMTDLFQHRFRAQSGSLSGHSIGNLLIAGLVEQAGGDYEKALLVASEVLAIRGRVIPSTMSRVWLRAVMEDGQELVGETQIVASNLQIRRVHLDPAGVEPHPEALKEIEAADLIVIGPGSVYTSVIPNLLVPGIADAIYRSNAAKAYVCNVMTQHGESDSFTAAEHLVALQANVDQRVCDYVLVNNALPTAETLEKYRRHDQAFVEPDVDRIRQMGFKPVQGNFINETDLVRHDAGRVAAKLIDLAYDR